jgi:hypothetical protein
MPPHMWAHLRQSQQTTIFLKLLNAKNKMQLNFTKFHESSFAYAFMTQNLLLNMKPFMVMIMLIGI